MGFWDHLRGFFRTPERSRRGLRDLDEEQIHDLVTDSLEETEATAEVVARARDAHERARDLMRQGLYRESLERFQEALLAWEEQVRICREHGYRNLWRGRVERVGREMEKLRIDHLDLLDPDSFQWLRRRAQLRLEGLERVLAMGRDPDGTGEREVYAAFPDHQREEVGSLLYQAQQRGWLTRRTHQGRWRLFTSPEAPGSPGGMVDPD
jgi:hypothetical protein